MEREIINSLSVLSGERTILTGGSDIIKQAEQFLLNLEENDPSSFALSLLSIIQHHRCDNQNLNHFTIPQDDNHNHNHTTNSFFEMNITISTRLAAMLTLKAMISRKWKDRGRSGGGINKKLSSLLLLNEQVKDRIRIDILSIVTQPNHTSNSIVFDDNSVMTLMIKDKQIQAQASAILSKIARFDLPLSFQNLIPTLIQHSINTTHPTSTHNALDEMNNTNIIPITIRRNSSMALEEVLSTLCTKHLLIDKKYISSISETFFIQLVQFGFNDAFQMLMNICQSNSVVDLVNHNHDRSSLMVIKHNTILQYTTFVAKIIQHLLTTNFTLLLSSCDKSSSMQSTIQGLFASILHLLPRLFEFIKQPTRLSHNILDYEELEKIWFVLMELVSESQKLHPKSFASFSIPYLDLFVKNLLSMKRIELVPAADLLDSKFNKYLLPQISYISNVLSWLDTESELPQNIIHDFNAFFNKDIIDSLLHLSLSLIMLQEYQLEEWCNDSEEFYCTQNNAVADLDLTACAQNLYLALVECHHNSSYIQTTTAHNLVMILNRFDEQISVTKIESGTFTTATTTLNCSGLPSTSVGDISVLYWDAVYTALGLSTRIIKQQNNFDFKAWFEACLFKCIQIMMNNEHLNAVRNFLPVLRHRIIWLLGNIYEDIGCNKYILEFIMNVISTPLTRQNDITVKLAAVQTFSNMIFIPDPDTLSSFLSSPEQLISALYVLANSCEQEQNQTKCLKCVSDVVSSIMYSGNPITISVAKAVIDPLQNIWEYSKNDEKALLRGEVLNIMQSLAGAIGREHIEALYPIAIPMLDCALCPTLHEDNLFLVEDSLKLWLTLIRLSVRYGPDLGALFGRAKYLLEQDLDHIQILMVITEGYILLGGNDFLNAHFDTLKDILFRIIGEINPQGVTYMYLVIEALLRRFPVETSNLFKSNGILLKLLNACADSYFHRKDCEPDRVTILYLTAISRMDLSTSSLLDGLLPLVNNDGTSFGYNEFIDLYFRHFDFAGYGSYGTLRQKVWFLHLVDMIPPCANLEYGKCLLQRMDTFLSFCLYILKHNNDHMNAYSVETNEDETFDLCIDYYTQQLQHEMLVDVISVTDARSVLKLKLQNLVNVIGEESHRNIFESVDRQVIGEVERLLTM